MLRVNKIYQQNSSDVHSRFGTYQIFVQESRKYFRLFVKVQDSEFQRHVELTTLFHHLSNDLVFRLELFRNYHDVSQTTSTCHITSGVDISVTFCSENVALYTFICRPCLVL